MIETIVSISVTLVLWGLYKLLHEVTTKQKTIPHNKKCGQKLKTKQFKN